MGKIKEANLNEHSLNKRVINPRLLNAPFISFLVQENEHVSFHNVLYFPLIILLRS